LSWFIGPINLSLEGPSAVKSIMIKAWAGWMRAIGIKCYLVHESTTNFWDIWGIWAVGAPIRGCVDIHSPFLDLKSCSSKLVIWATSFFTNFNSF
jgi:hypothetical protein